MESALVKRNNRLRIKYVLPKNEEITKASVKLWLERTKILILCFNIKIDIFFSCTCFFMATKSPNMSPNVQGLHHGFVSG